MAQTPMSPRRLHVNSGGLVTDSGFWMHSDTSLAAAPTPHLDGAPALAIKTLVAARSTPARAPECSRVVHVYTFAQRQTWRRASDAVTPLALRASTRAHRRASSATAHRQRAHSAHTRHRTGKLTPNVKPNFVTCDRCSRNAAIHLAGTSTGLAPAMRIANRCPPK